MGTRKKKQPSQFPACDNPVIAKGRAKRESGMSTLGHVAERFNAMVSDEAQAAYWRTYIKEYRIAWSKSWPKLCEMLDLGEKERAYAKPCLEDGVLQPVYQTFEDFCEAEVEPFVGPVASLREQYRRYKNGEIDPRNDLNGTLLAKGVLFGLVTLDRLEDKQRWAVRSERDDMVHLLHLMVQDPTELEVLARDVEQATGKLVDLTDWKGRSWKLK